ncbi:MAG TPA: DUF1538 domain-containing protein [Pseudolabrys sp.]|nr:DUF1538 domain-containing protein [Pseudolabrys sp.]
MLAELKQRLWDAFKTVAPLFGLVCLLQFTLVHAPAALFLQFIVGTLLVIVGMMLLFMGVELGILPMGRFIGAALPRRGSVTLILAVAFAVGFAVTVAEPDVLVLADQVERMSQGAISGTMVLYVVAVGVGICVALAMARIVYGISLRLLLGAAFAAVLVLSFFAPPEFVPLAFDAGSVTTGVLTAPVVIALAIGLSSVLAGRSAVADGFGLLGFASIGPIIAVMIMGMVLR